MQFNYVYLSVSFLLSQQEIVASGVLEIKFINYHNIEGKAHNGEQCPQRCNLFFNICLQYGAKKECLTTKPYQEDENNTVYFDKCLNNKTSNPWKKTFATIQV